MIRKSCGILLLLLAGMAGAQDSTLRLQSGEKVEILVPEAMMAFSRHSRHVRVLADEGSVFLAARQPGTTQIVVLTPTQVLTFNLIVGPDVPTTAAKPVVNPPSQLPASPPHSPPTIQSLEGKTAALHPVNVQPLQRKDAGEIEVAVGRTTRIEIPQATAALSVDSDRVDVTADTGVIALSGRVPGRAEVLVITPSGVKSLYVTVSPGPPSYPPDFSPPASSAIPATSGSYEFRFSSDRTQLQNRFDFSTTRPGRTTQLHLVNIDFLDGLATGSVTDSGLSSNRNFNLPSGFYRITTPEWNVTLLDQIVSNSPLTVAGATIRGLHLGIGPWTLHAGYAPLASFYDFLIPTEGEEAFGLSYDFKLTENSKLTPNVYYFSTPPATFTSGRTGSVASLDYQLRRPGNLLLAAELGFSHGLGAAAEFQWTGPKDFLHATFLDKPRDFASLSMGNLPGTQADFAWTRHITPAFVGLLHASESHILLPSGQETNATATGSLQHKFSRHWSASTGGTYSDFSQSSPQTASSYHALSLPEQINFDLLHFGAGFEYQFAQTSGSFHPGQDLRATTRFNFSGFQISAFLDRQTDALTVSSLYSQIPSLQIELQKLGITAVDPTQLMALLQDNAFLLALGLSQQATLNLLPVRLQTGANLSWTSHGPRPQRLNLDFVRNDDRMLQGKSSDWIQSGDYTLPISPSNELSFSYSWFRNSTLGAAQYPAQVQISLRHSFSSLPDFLASGGHGTLTGVVFVDDQQPGAYSPQMKTIPEVEVVLDGTNRTLTNDRGRYTFSRVPRGQHTLEAHFRSSRPFWFTTPSVVTTSIDHATVFRSPATPSTDFGITFAANQLIGYVKNDAGAGIPDVEIEVLAPSGSLSLHSDADGRFSASGLAPGDYSLHVDPNTVPAGYLLEDLQLVKVRFEDGTSNANPAMFRLRAMRTLTGQVTSYDRASGNYAALPGAHVKVAELARDATTDPQGKFSLRQLPAGNYTLVVSAHGESLSRPISIPPGPSELQENFQLTNAR